MTREYIGIFLNKLLSQTPDHPNIFLPKSCLNIKNKWAGININCLEQFWSWTLCSPSKIGRLNGKTAIWLFLKIKKLVVDDLFNLILFGKREISSFSNTIITCIHSFVTTYFFLNYLSTNCKNKYSETNLVVN